jgi:chitin synthase
MVYCFILTCWIPGFILRGVFGRRTAESQRAWREKVGIVSICAFLMGIVGYITFGFTQTVCGVQKLRIQGGQVNNGSLVINGYDYDFSSWKHPVALPEFNGSTSPIYMDNWMAGGKDASFLFQNVNKHCLNVIIPANNSGITHNSANEMAWYFPCNLHSQNNSLPTNLTGYTSSTNCHTSSTARSQFNALATTAEVYYTWDMVQDPSRNLAVFKS